MLTKACPPGRNCSHQHTMSHDSASSTTSFTLHFLPVLTSIPPCEISWSLDSLYCSTSLARVTMNSSPRLLKGSFSLLFLYKAMLLRLPGRPSHLRRKWLTLFSKLSTMESGNSSTKRGPEYLWEDAMLVDPGFKLAWQP